MRAELESPRCNVRGASPASATPQGTVTPLRDTMEELMSEMLSEEYQSPSPTPTPRAIPTALPGAIYPGDSGYLRSTAAAPISHTQSFIFSPTVTPVGSNSPTSDPRYFKSPRTSDVIPPLPTVPSPNLTPPAPSPETRRNSIRGRYMRKGATETPPAASTSTLAPPSSTTSSPRRLTPSGNMTVPSIPLMSSTPSSVQSVTPLPTTSSTYSPPIVSSVSANTASNSYPPISSVYHPLASTTSVAVSPNLIVSDPTPSYPSSSQPFQPLASNPSPRRPGGLERPAPRVAGASPLTASAPANPIVSAPISPVTSTPSSPQLQSKAHTVSEYAIYQELQAERLRQQAAEFQRKQQEAILRQLAFEEKWRKTHAPPSLQDLGSEALVASGNNSGGLSLTRSTSVTHTAMDDVLSLCLITIFFSSATET